MTGATGATPPPLLVGLKMDLREMLENYHDTSMSHKLILMVQIRQYLRSTPMEVLMNEISTITSKKELKILLGAGMKGMLYYQVVGQLAATEGF